MEESQLKDWKYEEGEGSRPVSKLFWKCQKMGCEEGGDRKREMGKLGRKLFIAWVLELLHFMEGTEFWCTHLCPGTQAPLWSSDNWDEIDHFLTNQPVMCLFNWIISECTK